MQQLRLVQQINKAVLYLGMAPRFRTKHHICEFFHCKIVKNIRVALDTDLSEYLAADIWPKSLPDTRYTPKKLILFKYEKSDISFSFYI